MNFGIEGGYATPTNKYEKSVLTPGERVQSALDHSLEGGALAIWMAMKPAGMPAESFARWVDEFNSASAEERGAGRYDHGRPGDENIDITSEIITGSGYPLSVTLHKNGEITFATNVAE
jgi:hypothetical protein